MLKALSVKQFNEYFKTSIKHDPILTRVYINGSLANIRFNGAHLYFSLKEGNDIIDCVIYYYDDKDIDFDFKEGMDVLVRGNFSYNNYSSRVVIITNEIKENGVSEEYLKFIKMKEDFKNRGYFDLENKKQIPKLPKNVGLITSKDGAAIVDFVSVINQKPNDINIKLFPVKVQGNDAVDLILKGLNDLEKMNLDVIVITRGGGSSEDLSVFNDKEIIEQVFRSNTPIISAIGHKIDTTLLDLVADLSLQTPTEAGSYIIANYTNLESEMKKNLSLMKDIILGQLRLNEYKLAILKQKLKAENPKNSVEQKNKDVKSLKIAMDKAIKNNIAHNISKLNLLEARLKSAKTLIESRKENIVIKNAHNAEIFSKYSINIGDEIEINFSDGRIKAVVTDG
ncbi:exodeoxyribonuclease VII large subunit [Anaerococcus sp. mt242]|uniref:exodeoxyribonuclease VII large subunit n=1 Tax=Anaerococcus sp. mt242 TaxID=2661917 RepID=UPI0019326538|nr:exodeoxyribonuclease VII large subunit [Anaerococcus sp. mt242]MBM0046365.1 exodeoxyribonuclease VII large subunit [Anaerococcus sp. mt242]